MLATYMRRMRNNNLKIIGLWAPLVARINTIRSDDIIFLLFFFFLQMKTVLQLMHFIFSQVLESVDVWESLSAKQSGGR